MQATSGFSADTEILTRHGGWVTFDRLTYMDEVATRSPDGRFEWQHPETITWQPYEGDMVWLHSRTTNLQVLPGTEIRYMKRHKVRRGPSAVELPYIETPIAAGDVIGEKLPLVATSRWEPASAPSEFTFTGRRKYTYGGRLANAPCPLTMSADDFAAFMGMYLAEGNFDSGNPYGIWIWQKHAGRGFTEYQDLLDRIFGHHVKHDPNAGGWHLARRGLHEFLATCGKRAWGKRIPSRVLDLPPSCLEKFWQFYSLGDGTIMNTGATRKPLDVAYTTSPAMAGAFQEILQKLGGFGIIGVTDPTKYPGNMGRRPYYRIVRRAGTVAFASAIERNPYAGLVGTVTVAAPAIYVRRNNRPVWSGT